MGGTFAVRCHSGTDAPRITSVLIVWRECESMKVTCLPARLLRGGASAPRYDVNIQINVTDFIYYFIKRLATDDFFYFYISFFHFCLIIVQFNSNVII